MGNSAITIAPADSREASQWRVEATLRWVSGNENLQCLRWCSMENGGWVILSPPVATIEHIPNRQQAMWLWKLGGPERGYNLSEDEGTADTPAIARRLAEKRFVATLTSQIQGR